MLLDCLYSSNKRAKNWRDKEREVRQETKYRQSWNHYYYDKYHNEEQANEKKEMYYAQKEIMLSVLRPVCIHKELIGYERRRIYDYEQDYRKFEKQFVWENCYYDHDFEREVWFGDIELKDKPKYHYYLFYDVEGNHTFHTPIEEKDISRYKLPVIEIDHLETLGHDVTDLISNQFVVKLLELIKSGNYTYIEE